MYDQRYVPGDPHVCCDICGFNVRMSQTRKTWDGLRVCLADWDPKHPQLSVRGKVDRQAVYDGRPEPADQFVTSFGFGAFCLQSPNGTNYVVSMADGGTLDVQSGIVGSPLLFLTIDSYLVIVDNSGNLSTVAATTNGPPSWPMNSPDFTAYKVMTPGGTITVSLAG